jgi:glucose/arabinose dehydrogenase
MRSVFWSFSAPAAVGIASVVAMTAFAPACGTPDDSDADEGAETGEDAYSTSGTCDGLPRLKSLQTPPGVCVGLVAQGFTFARGIAQLPSGDFVMAEMGGWAQDRGAVWILRRLPNGQFSKTRIAKLIDKPSGVAVGPDGLPYIGAPDGIFRFDPYEQNADPIPKTGAFRAQDYKQPKFQLVVKGLPGDGRHPLKKFAFDTKDPWKLYVNLGSGSDVCEQGASARPPSGYPLPCAEAEGDNARGAIRLYDLNNPTHTGSSFSTIAHGLRNSMALAVHPTSGALIQGENSRDTINKNDASFNDNEGEFPHEELNVIVPGSHYGWPYCYDNNSPNPEYRGRVDCSNYTAPALLLPPHASPLGATYYNGSMLPDAYKGQLLVTFHGYREYGHRLVMVPVDANGIPGSGEPVDIIRGWDKSSDGAQPLGSPVDVLVAKDGSLYVTEDKNGDVLRVFFDKTQGNGLPMKALPPVHPVVDPQQKARCDALKTKNDLFSIVEKEVIDQSCTSCHGVGPGYAGGLRLDKCDAVGNAQRLLAPRSGGRPPYVQANKLDSEMLLRLKGQGYPQMPAGGVSPEAEEAVVSWIQAGAPIPH